MTQLDVVAAKKALAIRLKIWEVPNPEVKAAGFIDDLVAQGWTISPQHETRAHPPQRSEECPKHPGSFKGTCSGCRADELAGDDSPPPVRHSTHSASGVKACRDALNEAVNR